MSDLLLQTIHCNEKLMKIETYFHRRPSIFQNQFENLTMFQLQVFSLNVAHQSIQFLVIFENITQIVDQILIQIR